MRRRLGKFSNPTIGIAAKHSLIGSSSFSTTAGGGGGGRGRGRGRSSSNPPNFQFTAPTPSGMTEPGDDDDDYHPKASSVPSGMGHGRGKALPSAPILPSFSSFKEAISSTGRGRGPTPPQQTEPQHFGPKRPIFFSKEEVTDSTAPKSETDDPNGDSQDSKLPSSIISVLSGAGRGKPPKQPLPDEKSAKEENRHLRSRQSVKGRGVGAVSAESSAVPRLSREDAVKKAVGILSTGGTVADESGRGRGGFRGRGTRGRGWRGRGRGRGREGRVQDAEDDDDAGAGLYLGDDADGEKLAEKIGPETMGKLVDAFEEMSDRVLPSPMGDAYLDALHTNFMIECEPEYLMEEFGTNPDIDEKPPIPLQDALEKMKPFLMAYEGIRSQEEWEEVVKETMEQVPIMKELVDYYSGPDRVTGKKQQEELERVAKTLPESAPASVKRFTEHAVLSLQKEFEEFEHNIIHLTKRKCAKARQATRAGDLIKNANSWISWCGRSHSITGEQGMLIVYRVKVG